MARRPKFVPRKRGLAWAVAGLCLALLAFARGAFVLFRPVPDSWQQGELWVDAALTLAGIALGALGYWLYRRDLIVDRVTPDTFLTRAEEAHVLEEIRRFEQRSSAEIRVHLEPGAVADIDAEAKAAFERLQMTQTRDRNGVLILVAVQEHAFAILGDVGIDSKVPPGFWDAITRDLSEAFRRGDFAGGLARAVDTAGEALAAHFPRRGDDVDELPNEISRR